MATEVPEDCAALIFNPSKITPELLLPNFDDGEIVPEAIIDAVLSATLFTEGNEDLLQELYTRFEASRNEA